MKFTVDKKTIVPALIEMSRSLPMNANPDILSGIKITASPEGLHLVVSNHDFILEKCIPVYPDGKLKIIHSGSVVIPGKYFLELIKKLPEEITIGRLHTHEKLSIQSEEISIALSLFKHEEYPVMPVLNISKKITSTCRITHRHG
ncbi:hypothetical protein [Mesobacillus subterraneus]|uniref:DNA polymerase III subunit beta n=1 Tax=Mesobacillus subterraneus TaxID=285983 RepID=A0A3R9FDG8_9BACI|nr:hypothetical protein [Mesobacillus subterraneus]RSD25544.1 hypothetical protein EJA10_17235 [Mesobacillus subterraneus]